MQQILGENVFDASAVFDPISLDFPRCARVRSSARGSPYIAWVPCGMPRIDDQFLECVFYLYRSREAAEAGENAGGTGFVTGVRSARVEGVWYGYGVTNKHVVHRSGFSVVRVNRYDGGVDVFEYEPHEWIAHPAGDDLAIIPMVAKQGVHRLRLFGEENFATREIVRNQNLGPGDDVFMVGRFIRHDGKETNEPSVRFGNISMRPMGIQQSNGFIQESFAVEMRSMPGYSGSPVFVYRDPWDMLTGNTTVDVPQIWLLGINWGHIVDDWEVKEKRVRVQTAGAAPVERDVRYVSANTGMNGVIPAWKLSELLHIPLLEHHNAMSDERLLKQRALERGGTEFAVALPPADAPDEEEAVRRLARHFLTTPPQPRKAVPKGGSPKGDPKRKGRAKPQAG